MAICIDEVWANNQIMIVLSMLLFYVRPRYSRISPTIIEVIPKNLKAESGIVIILAR